MRGLLAALIATLALCPVRTWSATYSVRVRWSPSVTAEVTGYRITAGTPAGSPLVVVDAGLPSPAPDGTLLAQMAGLDGRTDYSVWVTAVSPDGESVPSNSIAIGYAQVAARIDSDGDGLTDAVEDLDLDRTVDPGETDPLSADTDRDGIGDAEDRCGGTATGAAVSPDGCACAQIACDDGNPCNGAETCSAGTCRAGTAPSCDDGNACTDDACDAQSGCTHTGRPSCCAADADCRDTDPCTTNERCQAATCVATAVTCAAPADSCQIARCEPDTGCVTEPRPDGTACEGDDACSTAGACQAGACVGTPDDPGRGPRAVGIRRFTLRRSPDGYAVSANAYFAFSDLVDPGSTGMSIAFEDGSHGSILAAEVAGADLDATRAGWKLAAPASGITRLEIRPRSGTARVSLRATLPAFSLIDPSGVAGADQGYLSWRVRFGTACASALGMSCQERPSGARRCRPD